MNTPTQSPDDEEYQNAVESGQKNLAEEIAFRYATQQGFNIRAYHGTFKRFTVFEPSDIGIHFAKDISVAINRLDDKECYNPFLNHEDATILHVALSVQNPFHIGSDLDDWQPRTFFKTANYKITGTPFESRTSMYLAEQKKIAKDSHRFLRKIGYSDTEIVEICKKLSNIDGNDVINDFYTTDVKNRILECNIDAILYQNDYEVIGDDESLCYIVMNPNQVKSIEPICDNFGKLVPLSKRFDRKSPKFIE